jgi:DNA-binding transcriptional regulator YdaS (Cro superfamily)
MDKQQAIKLAGSAQALAKLLGITHQAVYAWGSKIPPLQVYRLMDVRPEWFRQVEKPRF